ncbi:restriction endonuclease subunit S [Micromonospora rifamycinica]|uniref:restriction endonuclease subunit S n=1 Tax=Micromonospora rifamycinica TaxID=291594 RepID=UPI0033D39580
MKIPLVPVRELAEQIRGVTYSKGEASATPAPDRLPILRAGNIQDEGLDLSDLIFVPDSRIADKQKIRINDVVIAASSGSLDVVGKAAQARQDFRGSFGAFCKVLRPNGQVEPRYFAHYFRTAAYRAKVSSLAAGANINNLRNEHLADLKIPLPPFEKQRRIADALDRADEVRIKRREVLAHLDELTHSIFLNLGRCNTTKFDWDSSLQLGQVADISSGITKGRKTSEKSLRNIPYLAVVNVQDKRLALSNVKQIEASEHEIERYRLCKDDLLLTEGGDPDKLGRGSLWNNELPEAIHQNHIFRVRINEPRRVHPVYLNHLVSSERGKKYFLQSAKQTTGIASINMAQLRRFPLLLPPIEVQQEFARQVSAVQLLREAHQASLSELDALFASLQDRAFRGLL